MSGILCVLAGSSPRQTITITLSSITANYTLDTSKVSNYRAGFTDVVLVINSYVYATTTSNAALTIGAFATGDTVTIQNNGYIFGRGGNGGVLGGTSTTLKGSDGGPAISASFNASIVNNGYIGGGGGGGASTAQSSGGGGAGGGNGGSQFNGASTPASLTGNNGTPTQYGGGGGWTPAGSTASGGVVTAPSSGGAYGYGGQGGGGGAAYLTSNIGQSIGGSGSGTGSSAGNNGTLFGSGGTTPYYREASGGGGGWGAAGGSSSYYQDTGVGLPSSGTYAGGAGGAAINKNGKTVTVSGSGSVYGAVNA